MHTAIAFTPPSPVLPIAPSQKQACAATRRIPALTSRPTQMCDPATITTNSVLQKHSTQLVNKQTGGTSSTVDVLAPLAAAAFRDDPFMLHLLCHDTPEHQREQTLRDCFSVILNEGLSRPDWRVLHMDDSTQCFALWSLMGKEPDTISRILNFIFGFIKTLGFRKTFRMASIFGALQRAHPTKTPHVYLMLAATHPDAQGKGVGSSVMRKMTKYLDENQLPAYTESSNPKNVPFYQRHGFEIVEQPISTLPDGIPTCTSMWREPKNIN